MNTQTHVLLAAAIVGGIAHRLISADTREAPSSAESLQQGYIYIAIVVGALLPDLSLFIMFGYAMLTGVPSSVIWSEMYYADFWQWLGALSNSIPVYLTLSILSTAYLRSGINKLKASAELQASQFDRRLQKIGYIVLTLSLAALAHCLTDLPLHHDDGHPHFWPISNRIYASPVSYWDVRHHALIWVPIECIAGLLLVAVIWRRKPALWVKGLLALAATSYAALTVFFFTSH